METFFVCFSRSIGKEKSHEKHLSDMILYFLSPNLNKELENEQFRGCIGRFSPCCRCVSFCSLRVTLAAQDWETDHGVSKCACSGVCTAPTRSWWAQLPSWSLASLWVSADSCPALSGGSRSPREELQAPPCSLLSIDPRLHPCPLVGCPGLPDPLTWPW